MDFILHNEVPPAVDQIETHPFHQQVETQEFLQKNNVQIESWGPFAEGKNNIFHNDLLLSIAGNHGKSVAQVILRVAELLALGLLAWGLVAVLRMEGP